MFCFNDKAVCQIYNIPNRSLFRKIQKWQVIKTSLPVPAGYILHKENGTIPAKICEIVSYNMLSFGKSIELVSYECQLTISERKIETSPGGYLWLSFCEIKPIWGTCLWCGRNNEINLSSVCSMQTKSVWERGWKRKEACFLQTCSAFWQTHCITNVCFSHIQTADGAALAAESTALKSTQAGFLLLNWSNIKLKWLFIQNSMGGKPILLKGAVCHFFLNLDECSVQSSLQWYYLLKNNFVMCTEACPASSGLSGVANRMMGPPYRSL